MYIQGKVCLSILNTWHDGPQWSGIQSLESVLFAIMSDVLTENPLENEPAYKNCGRSHDAEIYNRLVWWANVKTMCEYLVKPPSFATEFRNIMGAEFSKNKDALFKRIQESEYLDDTFEMSRPFAFGHTYKFKELCQKLQIVNS
jgi:hypothetical protein